MSDSISLEQLKQAYQEINNLVINLELERSRLRDQYDSLKEAAKEAEKQFSDKQKSFLANSGAATQLAILISSLELNKEEIKEKVSEEKKVDNRLRKTVGGILREKLDDEDDE